MLESESVYSERGEREGSCKCELAVELMLAGGQTNS